jgi:uncharacterized protein YjbI with pentapeptide repeats
MTSESNGSAAPHTNVGWKWLNRIIDAMPIWLRPRPMQADIPPQVQAEFIRQEHRTTRIILNALEFSRVSPEDPRRRAATEAVIWRLFSSSGVRTATTVGTGVLISIATVYLAVRANQIAETQAKLLEDQNRIASEQREQAMIQNALAEANRMALLQGEVNAVIKELAQVDRKSRADMVDVLGRLGSLTRVLQPYRALTWQGHKASLSERLSSRERAEVLRACHRFYGPPLSGEGKDVDSCISFDFSYSYLSGDDLEGVSIVGYGLGHADFRHATWSTVNAHGAKFPGAQFGGAEIYQTDFSYADLRDADLTEAGFSEVSFYLARLPSAGAWRNAKLTNIDFEGALVNQKDWLTQLRSVAAFDEAKHWTVGEYRHPVRDFGAWLRRRPNPEGDWQIRRTRDAPPIDRERIMEQMRRTVTTLLTRSTVRNRR